MNNNFPMGRITSTADYRGAQIFIMDSGKYVIKYGRLYYSRDTLLQATALIDLKINRATPEMAPQQVLKN